MTLEAERDEAGQYDISRPRVHFGVAALRIAAVLISLAGLLWIAGRWYRPGHVIAEIDLFPNYSPLILLEKTVTAWSRATSPFGSFDLPTFTSYYALQYALTGIANAGIAQILIFWLFMSAGWLGVLAVCRRLGLGTAASICAAWTYAFNSYSQFLIPWITGSAFAAALPWIVWMLHRGAFDPKARRWTTLAAVASAFTVLPWVSSTPQLFFELILVCAAFWIFFFKRAREGFAAWTVLTVTGCFIAGCWWLVPEFFALFSNSIGHATQSASVAWSFANSSLVNNLRFVNVWTWSYPFYIPYAQGYDADILTYAAGFWPSIAIAIALIKRGDVFAPLARFSAGVALVCMFLAKGPHPPFEQINALIYHIPGFFLLIEGGGLTIAALLCGSLCAGCVVERSLRLTSPGVWRARIAPVVAVAATAACALLSASPLINGLIFSGRAETGVVDNYVALPAYWHDAAAYLNAAPSGAIAVLPADAAYQARYDWGYEGVDLLPASLFTRAALLLGPSLDYLVDPRIEALKTRVRGLLATHSDASASSLRMLGIRYVLCRQDVAQPEDIAHDCNVAYLRRYAPVRRFGKLLLFDLGPAAPRFSVASAYFTGTYGKEISAGDFLTLRARLGDAPRVPLKAKPAVVHSVISEDYVACARVCSRRPASEIGGTQRTSPAVALDARSRFVAAFDMPQRPQNISSLDGIANVSPENETVTALPAVFETVQHAADDRSAYIFNPASSAVHEDVRLNGRPQNGGCVDAALLSPYEHLKGQVRFTMHACGQASQESLILRDIAFPPGLSELDIRGSFARFSADDVQFVALRHGADPIFVSPQGAALLSPLHEHAIVPGALANVSLSTHPVADVEPAFRDSDVNAGQILVLRRGANRYACYVGGAGPADVRSAARACFERNGIDARFRDVVLERTYADYSLQAGSLLPEARMAALTHAGVTASTLPLAPVLETSASDWQPQAGDVSGAVLSVRVAASRPIASLSIWLSGACDGRAFDATYTSALPINQKRIDERIPADGGSACKNATLRHVRLRSGNGRAVMQLLRPVNAIRASIGGQIRSIPLVPGAAAAMPVSAHEPVRFYDNGTVALRALSAVTAVAPPIALADRPVLGFARTLTIPPSANGALLTGNEAFASAWTALQIKPGLSVLPHLAVDGWRNAWEVRGGTTVLVYNMVDALELAFACAGFLAVLAALMRAVVRR